MKKHLGTCKSYMDIVSCVQKWTILSKPDMGGSLGVYEDECPRGGFFKPHQNYCACKKEYH